MDRNHQMDQHRYMETDRGRNRDMETDRGRNRDMETDRGRNRDMETDRGRDRDMGTDRGRNRDMETDRGRDRDMETDRGRNRDIDQRRVRGMDMSIDDDDDDDIDDFELGADSPRVEVHLGNSGDNQNFHQRAPPSPPKNRGRALPGIDYGIDLVSRHKKQKGGSGDVNSSRASASAPKERRINRPPPQRFNHTRKPSINMFNESNSSNGGGDRLSDDSVSVGS